MKKFSALLFIAFSFLILNSCYYDNFEEIHPITTICDTTGTITYAGEVSTIFNRSCGSSDVNCHKTGNTQDINLDDYTATVDLAVNGNLIGSILHQSGFKPMPPGGGTIDNCEQQKIQAWVNRGTPQN